MLNYHFKSNYVVLYCRLVFFPIQKSYIYNNNNNINLPSNLEFLKILRGYWSTRLDSRGRGTHFNILSFWNMRSGSMSCVPMKVALNKSSLVTMTIIFYYHYHFAFTWASSFEVKQQYVIIVPLIGIVKTWCFQELLSYKCYSSSLQPNK